MTEPAPLLLIVNGPPAAGKSTLAARLATDLRLPLFSKDMFKEALHDQLGDAGGPGSQQLGAAAFELLFLVTQAQLAARRSVLVEANFWREMHRNRFLEVLRWYPAISVEVHCSASPELLAERFRQRSGDRHPAHGDRELEDITRLMARHAAMELGGPVIEVETDDFDAVDLSAILRQMPRAIGQ